MFFYFLALRLLEESKVEFQVAFVNVQDYSVYFNSEVIECKVGRGERIFLDGVKRQDNCLCLDCWMSVASPALL